MSLRSRIVILFAGVALLLATIPAVAARVTSCVLTEKAARSLMPAACEGGEESETSAQLAEAPAVAFLGAPVSTTVGSWAQVLAARDLGGDRRAEAAVLTARNFDVANDEQLHLFQQGADALNRLQRLPAGAAPEAVVALDANLDGRLDVVGALAGDDQLGAFIQGPEYLSDTLALTQPGGPDALAAGDFTGDLRPDLAVALPLSDTIRLWRSGPSGLRSLDITLPFASDGYNALAVGDFNNDGQDDLAALRGSDDPAGTRQNLVTVFLQSSGTFPVSVTLSPETGGYLPQSLAAGDVNGDGRDDLVVTAGGNMPDAFLNVYLQGASGLAVIPTVLPAHHLPSAVAIADVNHDGREDVVAAHDGWRALSVYLQSDGGTLAPYALATVPYSSRYRPTALAVADLSGDGGLDVALVSRGHGLTVLNNLQDTPTAAITNPMPYATVSGGPQVVAGTTSPGTVAVQVRVRGLTAWLPATLTGTSWSASLDLPAAPRAVWIEARAINVAGNVQAPPAAHRVRIGGRVRDGLVVEYHFDERSGTTLFDRSDIGNPLDLTLANEQAVSRVPDGYFVHTPTAIASPAPAVKVVDALRGSNEFTLEAWVRTANLTQDGPARIMTLSSDSQRLNFSLVQSRFDGQTARVGLRLNTSTSSSGRDWHEAHAELPLTTDLTHIMLTRAADGAGTFYLNGVPQGQFSAPGDFSTWSDSYKLLFANDGETSRPWLGEYHLAAIYQRALSANEVGQNYGAGPVGDGSPAQLADAQVVYTFNEGSGATVADSSLVQPPLPARIADPDRTTWSTGSLMINGETIIATEGAATKVSRASMATGEISIEAWVAPVTTSQGGPARLLTISQNPGLRNVTLAQGLWGNQPTDLYLARLRTTQTSRNGEPHLNTLPGSLRPQMTHVVYTRDATGVARLFVDGEERARRTVGGDLSTWDPNYPLAIGNELTRNRPWRGTLAFAAVYSRALGPAQILERFRAGPEGVSSPSTTVGPFLQRVTINSGAATTAEGTVTLEVEAQMPEGRRLDQVTVAEYGFDADRRGWTLLRRGVPTAAPAAAGATTTTRYQWQLADGAGVRYLQVWVADSAGTVASYPYQTFINLMPARAAVPRGRTHIYRLGLNAGDQLTAALTSARGDADLYVWGSAQGAPARWVSNGRGDTDQVSFEAPMSGLYQIEVRGYSEATYEFRMTTGASATATLQAYVGEQIAGDKELITEPALSLDSAPADDAMVVTGNKLFLPLVRR